MATTSNKLSNVAVKQSQPKDKPYKLTDGEGLFLLVQPDGKKYWRLKYRFLGKEKLLAFGVYPKISLAEARIKREDAKRLISNGVDPNKVKQSQKYLSKEAAANTFEAIGREWYAKQLPTWRPNTQKKNLWLLEDILFPWLGDTPVTEITPKVLLATLRKTESRGAVDTAHRAKSVAGQVMRYAVATGRADNDPTPNLKGALKAIKEKHHAAITDPKKVGALLRAIDGFTGSMVVNSALRFTPLVFQRPGEIRHAEWSEINFDTKEWHIPADKMKMDSPHIVPLSKQAIKILQEIHPLTGRGKYVFPSIRRNNQPMSENTINVALRAIGYDKNTMSAHGFRAMARTILDEVMGERIDIIEQQLAHAVKDANGRAYNRTVHLPARHKMMKRWADYLDSLRAMTRGENVVTANFKKS